MIFIYLFFYPQQYGSSEIYAMVLCLIKYSILRAFSYLILKLWESYMDISRMRYQTDLKGSWDVVKVILDTTITF